jgi:acyl-CoA thioester hydrolase
MTVNTIREKYGLMLPRAEVHCQFKAACRFDDLVEVTLRVREVADKSITYDFQLFRKQEGQLAAEGYIKCIAVDSNWKVVKIPSDVAKAIREHA